MSTRRLWHKYCLLIMASSLMARGQIAPQQSPKGMPGSAWPAGPSSDVDDAKRDLESCRVHEVRGLPGSDEFASHFLEAIAVDPKDRGTLWGLTADLSTRVPSQERLIYLSKSTNGGARWTEVVRLDSRYFNALIAEGLRNGLASPPGERTL
jgi:hypothetical protein